jgi:ferrous iron transport protein A
MLRRHHRHAPEKGIHSEGIFPLAELQAGERAFVAELQGGHRLNTRLTAMGFTPGVEVSLIQNAGYGPLIACVRDARIAIGRIEAHRIQVKRLDEYGS